MNRNLKNILITFILIVCVISAIATINMATDESENLGGSKMEDMQQPPDGQGQNNMGMSLDDSPQKSEDSENNKSNDIKEPPEKPSGENQTENNFKDNNFDPSKTPSGNMPDDGKNMNNGAASSSNTTKYYVLLFSESLVFSCLLTYLIMSKLNYKNFKETFETEGKIALYIVITVLICAVATFLLTRFINFNVSGNGDMPQGQKMEGSSNVSYTATSEITEDKTITSGTYTSTNADENAILANGSIDVEISNVNVEKSGDSNGGDSTSFYGNNSAVLAKDGANLKLENIKVSSNANGANGVFCYGGSATTNNTSSDGTTIYISDSEITTTGDNAGGIMTTGGGTTNATNLKIETSGTSSAAIRTDRGGGTVSVDGGTYKTTGVGSPAIYSTANISVKNATLSSTSSEGVVIEGANSVDLENCNLTDNNTKLNGKSTTYKNVFLYQSMSGDASNGNATFTAKNSTLTTKNGDSFYVTNTTATITLVNNEIVNEDSKGNFLRVQKDSWGNEGTNGGDVSLILENQKAKGNIVVDSISTLDIDMSNGSYFEGEINSSNGAKSITLKIDSTSSIKLTADMYLTSFSDEDSTYSNIDFNGYKLYVNGEEIK